MKFVSCSYGFAVLACVALPIPVWRRPQTARTNYRLRGRRDTGQDRLSKFDAAIAGMKQDGKKRNADARAKASTLAAKRKKREYGTALAELGAPSMAGKRDRQLC